MNALAQKSILSGSRLDNRRMLAALIDLALVGAGGAAILVAVATGWLPAAYALYAVAGTATIWLFHADNIQRLQAGEERRIEWRLRGRPGPQQAHPVEPRGGSRPGR